MVEAEGKEARHGAWTRRPASHGAALAPPKAVQAARCHSHRTQASPSRCRRCQELCALRRYSCARCRRLCLICSRCDRGQLYCAGDCRKRTREESQRRAGAKYQQTPWGRRRHAARQARYRRRPEQKVTHQGSPLAGDFVQPFGAADFPNAAKEEPDVRRRSLPPLSLALLCAVAPPAPAPSQETTSFRCDFCGDAQSPFTRRVPLFVLRRRTRHIPSRKRNPP